MMGDPKFGVDFIRNFTIEPVELYLRQELSSIPISAEISYGGFSTAADDIVALSQRTTSGGVVVLALGLELAASDFGHASWSAKACCDAHLSLVQAAVEASPVPLVINTVLPPLFEHTGLSVNRGDVNHAALIEKLNLEIRRLADSRPGKAIVVDWSAFARELGEKETYDYRFWFVNGAPFARGFLARYASAIATVIRALAGKSKKLLILDCDETLWGGIVGEVGLEGIELSPNALPGAYYLSFQRSILDLAARGVILALCSKNNEADVFEVLDKHPQCLLKRKHFAVCRIGWEEKVESIVGICKELNIGLDSAVFIDDSPRECQLVSAALPDVEVLQLPPRCEDLVGLLQRCRLFDTLVITDEDLERTRSYHDNRGRNALLDAVTDLSEYKRKLGTKVVVRRAHRADVARVAQLVQRTNQFNLTTRRHDPTHIEAMLSDQDVWMAVAEVSDQFGDLGVVGVAIARKDLGAANVDTMLMSCRALGRDAEVAFAAWFLRKLFAEWRPERVLAAYTRSPKNQQASDFWKRMGFADVDIGDGGSSWYELFALPTDLHDRIVPDYIQMVEPHSG